MQKALSDPAGEWQRVSPRLKTAEHLNNLGLTLGLLVAACLPLALRSAGIWPGFPAWLTFALPAMALAAGIIEAIVIPFRVRNLRYALRADDLATASGVIYHRTEVIPYGRIQYVDVKAGPLLRALGLCTLQVHTASPDAHPQVRGLPRERGDELRDELARRGEERLAGL